MLRLFRIQKMQNIDQEVFDSLPPDIQIELLTSYKEALKAKKSENFEEFPEVFIKIIAIF